MATIEKRAKNRYRARIRRRGYPEQTQTFASRHLAQQWIRKTELEMDEGSFRSADESKTTTLAEALDRYEREVSQAKKSGGFEKWRIKLWKNSTLGSMTLAEIRSKDVAAWRDKRVEKVSTGTARNDLALLSHLFTIAIIEWGMDNLRNPVKMIRKPDSGRPRDRRILPEIESSLLDACREIDVVLADVVEFALETGARRGEIAALDRSRVSFKDSVAHIVDTKTGEDRHIPLTDRAMDVIKRQPLNISGKVFNRTQNLAGFVTRKFKLAARSIGQGELTFHDCRHEATSRFFERGFSMMEVASITGHKTMQMLKRYTHLQARDLARKMNEKKEAS